MNIQQMARAVIAEVNNGGDSLNPLDRLVVGDAAVRILLPLRNTAETAKHLQILATEVERARMMLSHRIRDERGLLLAVRSILRDANKKINPYRRVRKD